MNADKEELKAAWEDLLAAYSEVKNLCRMHLPRHDYESLKPYGFNYIESGLGEGDAFESMKPLKPTIEQFLEEDDEEEMTCSKCNKVKKVDYEGQEEEENPVCIDCCEEKPQDN